MSQNELAQPQNGAGQTTLQGAYDNDPTGAQILLDAVPNPLTVQAQVAGDVFAVKDVGGANILQVTANPDTVEVDAGLTIRDSFLNAGALHSLVLADTYTQTGAFIGGGILSSGTVTTGVSTTWVWALLQESKSYLIGINPAFAAFTLFNALATIGNSGNFNLPQALILNNGLSHRRLTAGTSTTLQSIGLSNSPNTRTLVAGAVMTKTTGDTAVRHAPTFTTVAGSTVNLGIQVGLQLIQPAVSLFGSQAGTENMTAYYGVNFPNMTFGGAAATYSVVRSLLAAGTNKRFLDHTGNAASRLRGNLLFDQPNIGVFMGAGNNVGMLWSNLGHFRLAFLANADELQFSNPNNGQILINGVANELTFNTTQGFSFGAQTGTNGNQFGNFVFGASTTAIAGEYSQFLLTQAGNLTVNQANMNIFAWTINAPSMTLSGPGTVLEAAVLNVGGNPNQGSVGRYGVRILSNPSGATDNYPLYVVNGTSRIANLITGDPGTEGSGITIGGALFDSALKVSGLGGGDQAQFIMHRHSTSFGPVIVGARANNDTAAHTIVADGQETLSIVGTGWDGVDYERSAAIRFRIDGTPGAGDMPGRIDLETTPNGSAALALALRINQAQRCDFQTNQALGGGAAATLGTIGGAGPTGAAQAQWLEIEIGGVIHWVPAWT